MFRIGKNIKLQVLRIGFEIAAVAALLQKGRSTNQRAKQVLRNSSKQSKYIVQGESARTLGSFQSFLKQCQNELFKINCIVKRSYSKSLEKLQYFELMNGSASPLIENNDYSRLFIDKYLLVITKTWQKKLVTYLLLWGFRLTFELDHFKMMSQLAYGRLYSMSKLCIDLSFLVEKVQLMSKMLELMNGLKLSLIMICIALIKPHMIFFPH